MLEAFFGEPVRILTQPRSAPESAPEAATHLSGGDVGHRHVRLTACGLVLSDAHLWFRRDLLPASLLRAMEVTDLPFGRLARGLGLRRETLSACLCMPGGPYAIEHRALLRGEGASPVAEVWERYCWDAIASG